MSEIGPSAKDLAESGCGCLLLILAGCLLVTALAVTWRVVTWAFLG